MPKIIIDDREIEVAAGTKVIEAAENLGIMIPRFCYHPALGSVGACRVCAVKFLQGPFKGVQMSCMVDAQDDMVVSTTDEEAVAFRKYVIEWLMLHHPHDCPVCDAGGHCLLQDMTVSGGHGLRRYLGKKRTYRDQYLGPLIQHEMNRCIHCYRCSRFYQEFGGYRDLGAMQSANQIYFGRFEEGILESPFSGNLIDICPTGVYTDKPSRYFGRRWDYERTPTLCINCALGCNTIASARYREVVRQEARFSNTVNGHFICDRGRYGFFYAGLEQRPRQCRIDGQVVIPDEALAALKQKLAAVMNTAGPGAVAWAGSTRSSLETLAMLKQVSQVKGWRPPVYFMNTAIARNVKSAISRLEPDLMISLHEIESADFIAVLGADPLNEAPMLAPAMRQAQRAGATVAVFDPRPVLLPLEFEHIPETLDEIIHLIGALIKAAIDPDSLKGIDKSAHAFFAALPEIRQMPMSLQEKISALAAKLRTSQRPVIVCGTQTVRPETPSLAADAALLLQAAGKPSGLFYVMPGANAFAAGLLSDETDSFETLVADIENGVIKGLILVESNPFWDFPDRQRLAKALARLELIAVMDYLDSEAAQKAHIFVPTTTLYESGGVYINQEARAQAARPAYRDGIPIRQVGSGNHPPRIYGTGIPGAGPEAAWQVLARLMDGAPQQEAGDLKATIWNGLTETDPVFKEIQAVEKMLDDGIRIYHPTDASARFAVQRPKGNAERDDRLELIAVEWIFGTEELSSYSKCLTELEESPGIFLSRSEAEKLNLIDGERVAIELQNGTLAANVRVKDNMAAGTLVIPRHKDLDWQKLDSAKTWIRPDQIQKQTD